MKRSMSKIIYIRKKILQFRNSFLHKKKLLDIRVQTYPTKELYSDIKIVRELGKKTGMPINININFTIRQKIAWKSTKCKLFQKCLRQSEFKVLIVSNFEVLGTVLLTSGNITSPTEKRLMRQEDLETKGKGKGKYIVNTKLILS